MTEKQLAEYDSFCESLKAYDPRGTIRKHVDEAKDPVNILRARWGQHDTIVSMDSLQIDIYLHQALAELLCDYGTEHHLHEYTYRSAKPGMSYTVAEPIPPAAERSKRDVEDQKALIRMLMALEKHALSKNLTIRFIGDVDIDNMAMNLQCSEVPDQCKTGSEYFTVVYLETPARGVANYSINTYNREKLKENLKASDKKIYDEFISKNLPNIKQFLSSMPENNRESSTMYPAMSDIDHAHLLPFGTLEHCLNSGLSAGELAASMYLASLWLTSRNFRMLWYNGINWYRVIEDWPERSMTFPERPIPRLGSELFNLMMDTSASLDPEVKILTNKEN